MAYRVSIPVENAIKIKVLLETEQLSICKGELKTVECGAGFTLVVGDCSDVRRCEYDAVVIATGTPRDVRMFDNPLVQNMLNQGLACIDPFGGVRVSAKTGGLINQLGCVDDRITVLGELTSGAFFFTSALDINSRHSASRANDILSRLSLVHDRGSYSLAPRLFA